MRYLNEIDYVAIDYVEIDYQGPQVSDPGKTYVHGIFHRENSFELFDLTMGN